MPQAEFSAWLEFFRLYPFDDFHRIHRPAAMIAASMNGEIGDKLDWLAPKPLPPGYSQADLSTFAAFGIAPPKKKD